jgi:hypothetical protein
MSCQRSMSQKKERKTMGTLMLAKDRKQWVHWCPLERKDSPYIETKFKKREMHDIGVHKNTKIFHTLALLW